MEFILFFVLCALLLQVSGLPAVIFPTKQSQVCPNIQPQEHITLEQVTGSWRLAYLFLSETDTGLDEDSTCVVMELTANNTTHMELALFMDSLRHDHVDRTTAQFPAILQTPGHWRVHTPFVTEGYLNARVIQAAEDHLVITFCGIDYTKTSDNELEPSSSEDGIDWRALFNTDRKKRSFRSEELEMVEKLANQGREEIHMWTIVLVKDNNVSALKFVEYAAVLMKHGFDVTSGELISFGKCPVTLNELKKM